MKIKIKAAKSVYFAKTLMKLITSSPTKVWQYMNPKVLNTAQGTGGERANSANALNNYSPSILTIDDGKQPNIETREKN